MPTPRPPRCAGFSLVEAMMSMAVLTVGMLGLASAYVASARADGQALHVSQATAIALGIGQSLSMLPWTDARLEDVSEDNNEDPQDQRESFKTESPVRADHQLNVAHGSTGPAHQLDDLGGIATDLDYNGDGAPDYEIYWNVNDCFVDPNFGMECQRPSTTPNFKQVGIIVRWKRADGGWATVTTQAHRFNDTSLGEF